MKVTLLPILALFVGAVALTSCSKEKKIERNLHKGGGEWNMEKYDYSSTSNSSGTFSLNLEDCGNLTFNKDGSGETKFSFLGTTDIEAFTYAHTLDQLTLTSDGSSTVYEMMWEKNNIMLDRTSTTIDNGDTTTTIESYVLAKK